MLVFNSSVRTQISLGHKVILPRNYANLTDSESGTDVVQRYLRDGILQEIKDIAGTVPPIHALVSRLQAGQHVVIQRHYALGDILLVTAVIESLIAAHPGIRVHFGTSRESACLVENLPGVETLGDLGTQRALIEKYGALIDLNNIPESYEEKNSPGITRNRIEIMCDYLGIEPVTLCPSYYLSASEAEIGDKVLCNQEPPFLGIAPISRRVEKAWPIEKWLALSRLWTRTTGGTAVLFHNKVLKDFMEEPIVSVQGYDLRTAAAIAYHMDAFVTLDSLWAHLAAALGIRQAVLASCTDGGLIVKGYPNAVAIQGTRSCSPCWYKLAAGGCMLGQHPACLLPIEPEFVLERLGDRNGT